ncbi:unnamed protein product [Sphagnum balticum]
MATTEESKSVESLTRVDIVGTGLSSYAAHIFHQELQRVLAEVGHSTPAATWQRISQQLLRPEHPYPLHQLMYYSTFRTWDPAVHGPPPSWIPNLGSARLTNLGQLLESKGAELLGSQYANPIDSYSAFQQWSVQHPERYFQLVFEEESIVLHQQPRCILDTSNEAIPGGQWLPGAALNIAESCLASKGKKTDSSTAIIWRDEGEDELPLKTLTLANLRAFVSQVANALECLGLQQGDAIAIDMPMNVYAVTAYLAIILAGFVVVSIADSFVPNEIRVRIQISKAKAIFTQDHILRGAKKLPLYSRVVEAQGPLAIVIPADGKSIGLQLREGDLSWDDFLSCSNHLSRPNEYKAVVQPIEAHANILFSSGTTGEPKAIPWTHVTPLRCSTDAWAHQDIRYGDVFAWPTNLGWMMGPYLIFGSFLNGATIALYNGAPHGHSFGKFVQDARVTQLGVVPSLVKTWKSTGCMASLDWSSIRCFCSTGEASSPDDYLWLSGRAGYKPVLEACGGTEVGGSYVGGSLVQPQSFSCFSTPVMANELVILDESGNPFPDSEPCIGEVALVPIMLGASSTLLNADHDSVYFKGMPFFRGRQLRRHGDMFERLVGGFYKAHGRADDTMNLGGIKTSAVEIERVCNKAHEAVLETAAIGVQGPNGGPDQLVIVAVLKKGNQIGLDELQKIFSFAVSSKLNPLFKVSAVAVVPEFPRTASNKVMRRVLRSQFTKKMNPSMTSKL